LAVTIANPTADTEGHLAQLQPESIERVEMTLEDAFISYVGERGEKTFFMRDGVGK